MLLQMEQVRLLSAKEVEVLAQKRRIDGQLKNLCVPSRYAGLTLKSFEYYDPKQEAVFGTVKKYIDNFSMISSQPRNAFFTGPFGTGKTMAAFIISESIIKQGFTVKYCRFDDLVSDIKGTWSKAHIDTEEFIKSYAKYDLLIIDEFGRYEISEQDHKLFSKVMDHRYDNKKPNLIISNLMLDGNPSVFRALGERLADRMKEGKIMSFVFNWASYRAR